MSQKRFDTATKLVVKDESVRIDSTGPGNALEFVDYTSSTNFSIDENGIIACSSLVVDSLIDISTQITTGYIATLSGESGLSVSVVDGDATLSIGQDVSTTSDVVFSGLTISETLTVNGNFISTGPINSFSTETFEIDASFIVLNSDEDGSPSEDAGIEIERGSSNNVLIRWNETTDKWQFTNDGSIYKNIGAMSNLEDAGDAQISSTPPNDSIVYYDGSKWIDSSFGYSEPVGAIMMMPTTSVPNVKWKVCDGQSVSRTTYSELWDLLRNGGSSSPYGNGDGSTTFNLPNMVSYPSFGVSSVISASASFLTSTQGSQHSHPIAVDPNTAFHSHSSISVGNSSNTHAHSQATFADSGPHAHNANSSNINTVHAHNVSLATADSPHGHPGSAVGGGGGAPHTHPYRSTPATGATSGANPHPHSHSRPAYNTLSQLANHSHFVDFGNDAAPHDHPSPTTNSSPTYNHTHNIDNDGPSGGHSHTDGELSSGAAHVHDGDTTSSSSQPHSHTISSIPVVYMIKVLP